MTFSTMSADENGLHNGKRDQLYFMVQWENSAYFKHVAVVLEVNEVGDTMHGLAGVFISVVEAEVEEHVQIQEFPMCCL